MKNIILIVAVLMLTGNVWAADECIKFDYSEIKDMTQEDLLSNFCNASQTSDYIFDLSMNINFQQTYLREKYSTEQRKCEQYKQTYVKILTQKFKVTPAEITCQ